MVCIYSSLKVQAGSYPKLVIIQRLEDAYASEDMNLELIIRSDKGVYCKAQIHIPPYKDFLSIKMEIISQESSNMIWQTLKAKLSSLSTRWKKRSGGEVNT